jgi:hypothetical protein
MVELEMLTLEERIHEADMCLVYKRLGPGEVI